MAQGRIRPMPDIPGIRGFALCREWPQCRYGDRCTYAHGEEERRAWNALKFGAVAQSGRQPRQTVLQPHPNDSALHHSSRDYAARKTDFLARREDELSFADIEKPLTRENYKEKFHLLLCWEEKTHIEILEKRCTGHYRVTLYEANFEPHWLKKAGRGYHVMFGCISGLSGDQIAYATQASEAAVIVQFPDEIKADIVRDFRYTDECLYIAFNNKNANLLQRHLGMIQNHCIQPVDIEFEVKHSYFNNLHKAIECLPDEVIVSKIMPKAELFTEFPHSPRPVDILKPDGYSSDQRAALQVITSCPANVPPVLITGAFGTGKTRLLASAAYCILEHALRSQQTVRVLVCAHHQASADTFLECYCKLTNSQHPRSVHLTRLTSEDYHNKNADYEQWYKIVSQFKKEVIRYRENKQLLTVTTCLTSLHLIPLLPWGFFTHIFLDEGAQAREPELVAPLALATNSTRIVIAGDHCQVGPALLVLGDEAREHGLKSSLLERLLCLYRTFPHHISLNYCATLVTNYRCHSEILALPAKLFYPDSPLKCKVPETVTHPNARYPLLFVCSSLDEEVQAIDSVTNDSEAKILLQQVSRFTEKWPRSWGAKDLHKVCIITQTRSQISLTRRLINKGLKHLPGVRMLPTYDIQGQEFHALFLGTSEPLKEVAETCNPTKSVCDRYIFNTVITRARSLVVSVGNPFLLLKTEKHMIRKYGETGRCWTEYLKLCLQHGTLDVSIEPEQYKREKCLARLKELVCIPVKSASKSSGLRQKPQLQPPKLKQCTKTSAYVPSGAARLPETTLSPCSPTQRVMPPTERVAIKRPSANSAPQAGQRPCDFPPEKSEDTKTAPIAPIIQQQQQQQQQQQRKILPGPGTKVTQKALPTASCDHPQLKALASTPGHSTQKAKVITRPLNDSIKTRAEKCSVDRGLDPKEYPSLEDAAKVKESKRSKTRAAAITTIPPVKREPHHSDFYRQFEGQLSANVIRNELTAENYKEKFHHLLCWEEKEHERLLANRCDGTYRIILYQVGYRLPKLQHEEEGCRYGIISGQCGDTVSYAKQASEGALLILPESPKQRIHVDFVFAHSPTGEGIPFAINKEETQNLTRLNRKAKQVCDFNASVQFQLKHSYFKRLHDAVHSIPKTVIAMIMPTRKNFECRPQDNIRIPKPKYTDLELDKTGQLQALYAILTSNSNAPLLVTGPFGTGKTRVLASAAYQILRCNRQARILVCAHHQASVDTFMEYFVEMRKYIQQPVQLVRIIPNNSYHSKTRDKYHMWYKMRREVKNTSSFNLIVTTLAMTLHLRGQFTHILMDEGAQTREPESIAPLCLATEQTKIVIAGDHNQVGPKLLVLGKEAQKNGLGVSLLERLHKRYEELGYVPKHHCITLLSNYRCHSGILTLCSSLYYGSTLQCKVPESSSHPDAPYPLVFVCSALDKIDSFTSDTNETEARILLDQVNKFVNHWPECTWGKKDVSKVCIMTPSANQKSFIIQSIWKKDYKHLKGVEVLTAYDIQGREYRAIFIGTSETTEHDGTPCNLTKSICDRYVFNTAISRAQSLVVCVGNPFMLLQSEKYMIAKYEEKGKCWSEYLRRCLEYQTFYPPPATLTSSEGCGDSRELLVKEIFSCSDLHALSGENKTRKDEGDSIMSAYYKEFEKIPECKRAKLLLSRRGNNLSWQLDTNDTSMPSHVTDYETTENLEFVDVYKCLLNIKHYRKAEAVPLDPSKKLVNINGLNNRRCAFNGDIVEVGIFHNAPGGKFYGKVVKVIAEDCPNQRFVCTVYRKNPTLFSPVDKKNPLITNLPPLSRDLLKRSNIDTGTINTELDSKVVVVFRPQSVSEIEKGMLPQMQHVIPLSVAHRMLFVVQFLQWKPKYRIPLGMVVSAMPKGVSAFHAERLLKVEHSIEYNDDDDPGPEAITDSKREAALPLYDRAFTVDPEGARNLDDAVSLQLLDSSDDNSEQRYELSVHIVNAAKHISCDSEADCDAKLKGISAYGGKSKTMHMLPRKISKHLSLLPHYVRDAISVCAIVTIANDTVKSVHMPENPIIQAQVKSSMQLTYKVAQAIMDNSLEIPSAVSQDIEQFNSFSDQPKLTETLQLLYRVALFLRLQRLSDSPAAAYCYDVTEPEERACWQAHFLIEELMIWANSVVAHTLYHSFTDCALLRRHAAPNTEEQSAVIDQHSMVMGYSPSMQHFAINPRMSVPIVVPHFTLQEILRALESRNLSLLVNLATSDNLYPQLAVARAQLQSTLHSAEYCCTSSERAPSEYKHYGLSLNFYTHFSSPLRRYFDVQVQRMALSLLSNSVMNQESEQVPNQTLCRSLNTKSKNAKQFDRAMNKLRLALKYTSSSEVYTAFVSSVKNATLELTFPDVEMKVVGHREKSCQIRHLQAKKFHTDTSTYSWKIKMTSFENSAHILHAFQTVHKESTKASVQSHDNKAQCSGPAIRLEVMQSGDATSSCSHLRAASYHAEGTPVAVNIQPAQWGKVLKFAQNPTESALEQLRKLFIPLSALPSSKREEISPFFFLIYHMTRSLSQYDMIKVWMTWSIRDAFLKPSLQLIQLAPHVRICVQHNSHPAECFSDPILSNASKKRYNSIEEYVQLWEKILLAEAAQKSASEGDPVIIQEVTLTWPKLVPPQNCMDEIYYEPSGYVAMKIPENFFEQSSEFFRIRVGDMVCIRYGTDAKSEVRAVYHMVIKECHSKNDKEPAHKAMKNEEPTHISMASIGKHNCRISERMKFVLMSAEKCEIQIIAMSTSYQRVYKNLMQLTRPKKLQSDKRVNTLGLVYQVALGNDGWNKVKYGMEACELFRRNELARTLWSDGNKKLNPVQIKAVELALQFNFQLIQGPPGTGKSETGAHIAYVFALLNRRLNQQNRESSHYRCIIYCGPSNKAVDVVLEKLHRLNKRHPEKKLKMLRIYGRAVERKAYPGPYKKQDAFPSAESGYDYEAYVGEYALHHKIRHSRSEASTTLVQLEKQFRDLPKDCIATSEACRTYKDALSEAEAEILAQNYDIVLCTCNEASSTRIKKCIFPRQCIIDECGMAFEPEAIAPLCLCEHAVLIGDHKQLQPVIEYPPAREHGLSTSLFQRYAEHFSSYCKTLTIQYRMHRSICDFPSKHFYERQLETDVSVRNRKVDDKLKGFWPNGPEMPILFLDVIGKENHLPHTTSKCNNYEAQKVVEVVRVLHCIHEIELSRMAVLTPYKAQKEEIRKLAVQAKLLSEDHSTGLNVASITESQGDEYDIVLLSTVRSQPLSEISNEQLVQPDRGWLLENLGFLTDEHEINVGITRSKIGLIIVGNARLLEYDDTWKALLAHYRTKGCVVKERSFLTKEMLQKL